MPVPMPALSRCFSHRPRFLDAFAATVCACLAITLTTAASSADSIYTNRLGLQVEALKRLKGTDLDSKPALKSAVLKVLDATRGTPQFVELVRELNIKGQAAALLEYASKHPADATGVDAARLALNEHDPAVIQDALTRPDASGLVQALGNVGGKEATGLLLPLATNAPPLSALAEPAVRALAQTADGAHLLLANLAALHEPMKSIATAELRRATWPDVKQQVAELLPASSLPPAEALPPVADLVKVTGDPARGAEVFRREQVGCIRCHQINGDGTDFGPNLSEIGTKLAKEAIYEAILDPSAGISFGFEAWQLELKNGDEAYGLLASETADELAIKTQNGIVTRYRKSDIATQAKQKTSIMPAGLAATMSRQDLVDLVEYLASRKRHPGVK